MLTEWQFVLSFIVMQSKGKIAISSSANSLQAAGQREVAGQRVQRAGKLLVSADQYLKLLQSGVFPHCLCFPSLFKLFFQPFAPWAPDFSCALR